jgi:type III secretion protein Q
MLPPELIAAGLEAWLGQALDAFSAGTQRPNHPLILEEAGLGEKEASHAGDMLGFLLQRASDGAAVRGVLAFTPEAAQPLAELAAAFPALPMADWDRLPVAIRREIGVCTLLLAELISLNPGDIVFPEEYFPQSPGGPRLSVDSAEGGTLHFLCLQQNSTLTIRGWQMSEAETEMRDEETGGKTAISEGPLPEACIDELSVRVTLELDALILPLSTLREMRAGYVLETGKGVENPVTIRIGGKIVGTGELLDVAGRVGVRIRAMRPV